MSFNSFFREDNLLFRGCNQILDVVMLSILWVFGSLPIVTIGPATSALYFTVVTGVRAGETLPYGRFLRSFKENLKVGVLATLICVPVLALLAAGVTILGQATSVDSRFAVLYAAYSFACVLPMGVMCYLFPLLGRFSFTLRSLFSTALALSIRHLPSTIVVVVLTVLAVLACLMFPVALFLLPYFVALISSLFFERIFKKYLPEAPESQPEEDTQP